MKCFEREYRARLSEPEFWMYVTGVTEDPNEEEISFDEAAPPVFPIPCPVCGELTACSYDSEGRPLIHTVEEDSENELLDS